MGRDIAKFSESRGRFEKFFFVQRVKVSLNKAYVTLWIVFKR